VSKYAEKEHSSLTVVAAIPTNEKYGFAFPNDSDALREAFNEKLAEAKEDGTISEIQDKWLGTDPCKGLPESEGT
jgi:ABC-type amino acid transport substrate-binding protein